MTIQNYPIEPIIALVAGVCILIVPGLLSYVVAIYLIAVGVVGLSSRFLK